MEVQLLNILGHLESPWNLDQIPVVQYLQQSFLRDVNAHNMGELLVSRVHL